MSILITLVGRSNSPPNITVDSKAVPTIGSRICAQILAGRYIEARVVDVVHDFIDHNIRVIYEELS